MKKVTRIFAVIITLAMVTLCFAACKKDAPAGKALMQFDKPLSGQKIATMTIKDFGEVKIMLFDKQAPKAVENFISLSEKGYYDGITFHRIMANFMIQGGDPEGTGSGGKSKWGKSFSDEFSNNLRNFTGALSMANSGPNTNGSQFFINYSPKINNQNLSAVQSANQYSNSELAKYQEVGGNPHLDNKHTVFGQVFEGLDIVKKVSEVKVDSKNAPSTPVVIETIKISTYDE